MLLLNIEYVPGKEIEALGLVKGTVVRQGLYGGHENPGGRGDHRLHRDAH